MNGIALSLLLLTSGWSTADVVAVQDGDTITIRAETGETRRVRLSRIDAPELAQPHGTTARAELVKLVRRRQVLLVHHGRDRYDRLLADVFVDGQWVNQVMVDCGHAWHYTAYDRSEPIARAQQEARDNRRGLWAAETEPDLPWEWRKKRHR